MKDLIIVGKQGAGKGTMGELLVEKYGYQVFETGAELRKIAQSDTDLGRQVKEITTRGDLVPNEVVMEIVQEFLAGIDSGTPVLFDGIPRSEPQRVSLEAEIEKAGRDFEVLELELSNEVAITRLLRRAKCNACGKTFGGDTCPHCGSTDISRRADDNEEAIKKRLENFDAHTSPLLDVWKDQGRLVSVDGSGSIEEVWKSIEKTLGS